MTLTLHDIIPVGLCISTQDLFDAKRFQANFCDNLLLRVRDKSLEAGLTKLKRELNSISTEKKYLDGHKTAIVSNIDKILSLVASRYLQFDLKSAEEIIDNGKDLIQRVLLSNSFDEIATLEGTFKSTITLPVYSLFTQQMKNRS